MAKGKSTAYFCSDCGYESAKWTGQCPACKSWNTMVEEPVSQIKTVGKGGTGSARKVSADTARPVMLSEIVLDEEDRIRTGFDELDRVLGSGIVRGSLVLVGGDRASESPRFFCRFAVIWRDRTRKYFTYRERNP